MDYVNLVWLDLLPCITLLQLAWPFTEQSVASRVQNYMLYCLPILKTNVVICLFNCLTALEAKYCPGNDSIFIMCFMTYMYA